MKIIFLLCLLIMPLREVVDVQLTVPTHRADIFRDYTNANFTQKIVQNAAGDALTVHTTNRNYYGLNLDFRVIPNRIYMNRLPADLRECVDNLLDGCDDFECYFRNISHYLRTELTYTLEPLPQDGLSVFRNKKALCIGYANLVSVFLKSADISHRPVRGFYLRDRGPNPSASSSSLPDDTLIPVPHRWLEIEMPNGNKFFYDPQYQTFTAYYIAAKSDIDFKTIKRFNVILNKKSKKIIH